MYKLGKTYTYRSPSFKQEPRKANCHMEVVPLVPTLVQHPKAWIWLYPPISPSQHTNDRYMVANALNYSVPPHPLT